MRRVRVGERDRHPIPLGVCGGAIPADGPATAPKGSGMSLDSPGDQKRHFLLGANGDQRGPRLVARTLFREMQRSGFTHGQVLAMADELLGCLCAVARSRDEAQSQGPDGAGS